MCKNVLVMSLLGPPPLSLGPLRRLAPPAFCVRACASLVRIQTACCLTAATAILLVKTLRNLALACDEDASP